MPGYVNSSGGGGVGDVDDDAQGQGLGLALDLEQTASLIGDIMVVQRSSLLTMKREMWDGGMLERNRQDEGTFGSHLQVGVSLVHGHTTFGLSQYPPQYPPS